jgi:predicted deacetylase
MKARYIFRLDDATSFMDTKKWKAIEEIFQQYGIVPIVAVTPDNRDPDLMYQELNPNFWKLIKEWEDKGWEIAMHGYQHLYHKVNRKELLFPYYDRSEFAGLTFKKQQEKIRKSIDIFRKNGFDPKVWVAPSHSFDCKTLRALLCETNINIVSDGIAQYPFHERSFYFIPQQLWSVKKKKYGVWTICLHPDTMSYEDIEQFKYDLSISQIYKAATSVKGLNMTRRQKSVNDKIYSFLFWRLYDIKSWLRRAKFFLIE